MPRSTRKHKCGGARGEHLRFIYTTNPRRVGWTEVIYPLAQFFLRIPSQIPWADYEYVGPTTVDVDVLDSNSNTNNNNATSWSTPTTLRENRSNAGNNNVGNNGGLANTQIITVEPQNVVNAANAYAAMFNYKELSIRARCHPVPYELFGGSVCELYDRQVQQSRFNFVKLHDTTDPTGDMDILMNPLNIQLTHPDEIEPAERNSVKSVAVQNRLTGELSPVYDHFTRWIIGHITRLLRPIARQVEGPDFFQKQQAGNAELAQADILEHVGNFLVSRAVTRNMLKIQCGLGVNTLDGPIGDHVFELIIGLGDLAIDDTTHRTYPPEMASTYSMPVVFGPNRFNLFVQDPVTLLNGQAKGFIDRVALRNSAEYKHKLYNHYGRILFCIQLLIWAHVENIGPRFYRRSFFPYLDEILDRGLLDLVPSPCYEPCKKNMIEQVYLMALRL
jgi:hypothetical protein